MTYVASVLVEACVDTPSSAARAVAAGAGRLELCDNLVEGGTTPSPGMLSVVRAGSPVPVLAMIRPRGGDFLYAGDEIAVMLADIAEASRLGADGVVIGALMPDGRIDPEVTRRLVEAARPMQVTFHRAFDLTREPMEALDALLELGVDRVLTSGQAKTALEGIPVIHELVRRAEGRIAILAGGGISEENAARIVRETGVREIHMRGSTDPARVRAVVDAVRDEP